MMDVAVMELRLTTGWSSSEYSKRGKKNAAKRSILIIYIDYIESLCTKPVGTPGLARCTELFVRFGRSEIVL